jgi:hypothetical protein
MPLLLGLCCVNRLMSESSLPHTPEEFQVNQRKPSCYTPSETQQLSPDYPAVESRYRKRQPDANNYICPRQEDKPVWRRLSGQIYHRTAEQ